jgi:hypothetical protein
MGHPRKDPPSPPPTEEIPAIEMGEKFASGNKVYSMRTFEGKFR